MVSWIYKKKFKNKLWHLERNEIHHRITWTSVQNRNGKEETNSNTHLQNFSWIEFSKLYRREVEYQSSQFGMFRNNKNTSDPLIPYKKQKDKNLFVICVTFISSKSNHRRNRSMTDFMENGTNDRTPKSFRKISAPTLIIFISNHRTNRSDFMENGTNQRRIGSIKHKKKP